MFFYHVPIRSLLAVGVSAGMVLTASAAPYPAPAPTPPPVAPQAPPPTKTKSKSKANAAAPQRSTLAGKIFGADGTKGQKGAIVELRRLDGGESLKSAPSDARGRFEIKGLDYGWAEVVIDTEKGQFFSDQAINLPPGRQVTVSFSLLETQDRPESWWKDRSVEPPTDLASNLSGMAAAQQQLTGVEYWKSPTGIAILVGAGVLALGLIAIGGRGYKAPATPTSTPPITTTP